MKNSLEKRIEKNSSWVTIDYSVIPKETFDRYGAKPFQIMKNKMRNEEGEVWNNISFNNAKKEANNLGYRLPHITEMLVLLDAYKSEKGDKASIYDSEFLGIEELSYETLVCFEFIDGPTVFRRGLNWGDGTDAGALALHLNWGTANTRTYVGFRCVRDI